jgi:hypothetical protein
MRRVLQLALGLGLALGPMRAGAGPAGGGDATVTAVHQQVEVVLPSPRPVSTGDRLRRGDQVRTPTDGGAEVACADRLRLLLGAATEATLGACGERGGRRDPAVTLARGSLLLEYPGKGSVVVATPAGRVKVGQAARVTVDERGETRVMVHRGRVKLTAKGRTLTLRAGQGGRAEPGSKPKGQRALPPAPRWTSPPRSIQAGAGRLELTAEYASTAKRGRLPHGWRVQVARDQRFLHLVHDERVDGKVTRLVARNLAPVPHFARVIAVDEGGWEGPPGPVVTTAVATLGVASASPAEARVPAPAPPARPKPGEPPAPVARPAPAPPGLVVLGLPDEPPAAAPRAVTPPVAGPPTIAVPAAVVEPTSYPVSLGLVGGLLVELPGSRLGAAGMLEGRAWARLGRGSLTFGLRVGYEHYRVGSGLAAQAENSTCSLAAGASTGELRTQHIVELSFPITYRFLGDESRLNPYLGVLPQVLLEFDRVDNAGRRGSVNKENVAVSGIAGLEILIVRRVAFFVEVGYRRADLECSPAGYTLHGLLALGGLRLGL